MGFPLANSKDIIKYMEQIMTKKEFDELMNIKGEVRGASLTDGSGFMEKELGKEKAEEGGERLEKTITELGYPIKFSEIKPMGFYPIGLLAVILVLLQRMHHFTNEQFQEMGSISSRSSLLMRLFIKYFFSLEKVVEEFPKMHRKYMTVGDAKVVEGDLEKKYVIIRIENLKLHPLHCETSKGSFLSGVKMLIKGEVTIEETKCVHRGDEYHEYLLKW